MSLSAEYCSDKTGDWAGGGGGAALAHQRRLIRGLLVWATLLTLGLGTSITLHFIHRESPAPSALQNPEKVNQTESKKHPLAEFSPAWNDNKDMVGLLKWNTLNKIFIDGKTELLVKESGYYFLYLQVTLASHENVNHTITLKSKKRNEAILEGTINGSKLSTIFMAKGFPLNREDTLTVTCNPTAKIQTKKTETYLGVIKINST